MKNFLLSILKRLKNIDIEIKSILKIILYVFTLIFQIIAGFLFLDYVLLKMLKTDEIYLQDVRGEVLYSGRKKSYRLFSILY